MRLPGRQDVDQHMHRDPVVAGGLRPFALQGGHRFGQGEAAGTPSREEYEATLEQYEAALLAAEEQLDALKQEYTDVYARYAEAFGQQG